MLQRISKLITASGMAAALTAGSLPKPAAADTQSTINTLIGAAAVIGGIILYNNYEHKRQAANTIVGYTRNGGTVYGDGRIVMPNGQTIYPNSNGQYPWGQTAYWGSGASGYAYDYNRTGRWDTTHRHWSPAYARTFSHPVYTTYSRPAYVRPAYARPVYHPTYVNNTYVHNTYVARPVHPAPRYMQAHDNGRHVGWEHQAMHGAPPPGHGHDHDRGPGHEHGHGHGHDR